MTYYSALHYAAKAEKSANLAEQYATQATQFSGKVIQIGFDGFMENRRLVFKHSPAGVDIPYDLLDDYEYEIDMAYSDSDLADDVELVVKNGADTINFVSALHRDSTTPVTVKDMKSVMRYDERTGYRWLFKAAFKITPSGNKVLLLYPVISVGGSGTGRNIGDIFYTSRLDNELNGAVEANGAVYSVEAFTGEKSVPELLRKGSLPFVSLAEYESIVSAEGSCRAWGWDNGDTFRVPTLKDVYLMAGQAESAGEFISESLPNITGEFASRYIAKKNNTSTFDPSEARTSGAVYCKSASDNTTSPTTTTTSYFMNGVWGVDASHSSSAYKDGAKVRPDSVRYRAMVQLSTGATDEALMTCTGVLSDVANLKQNKADVSLVNGKANTDASNFTVTAKEKIVGWGLPDYSAGVSIPFTTSMTTTGQKQTMPFDGEFIFSWLANSVITTLTFSVNGVVVKERGNASTSMAVWNSVKLKVSKGDVVKINSDPNVTYTASRIISTLFPCKGV